MSRIYEALQRAELERNTLSEGQQGLREDLLVAGTITDPLPNKLFLDLEDISMYRWEPSAASLPSLDEQGETAEQFRRLRSQVYLLRLETKLKTVLISSGVPEEGKSFIAANLAFSFARNKDCRVLLVDGDLRRPSLHKLLGAPQSPGLAEYLVESAGTSTVMQRYRSPRIDEIHTSRLPSNLTFMPAGDCAGNVPEIIGNHRFEELIEAVAPHFDWIIIDSPPVLAVTDAVDLARAADAVLLVARAGSTPYDVAQRARAAFRNSRVLGFVLNAAKKAAGSDSYYPYYTKQEASSATKHGKN